VVIVLMGVAGAGKTSVGRALSLDVESLLKSQLTTLEEPSRDEAVIVDARLTQEDIVTTIRRAFEV
jgi:gluconate kinase